MWQALPTWLVICAILQSTVWIYCQNWIDIKTKQNISCLEIYYYYLRLCYKTYYFIFFGCSVVCDVVLLFVCACFIERYGQFEETHRTSQIVLFWTFCSFFLKWYWEQPEREICSSQGVKEPRQRKDLWHVWSNNYRWNYWQSSELVEHTRLRCVFMVKWQSSVTPRPLTDSNMETGALPIVIDSGNEEERSRPRLPTGLLCSQSGSQQTFRV